MGFLAENVRSTKQWLEGIITNQSAMFIQTSMATPTSTLTPTRALGARSLVRGRWAAGSRSTFRRLAFP
eukprot:CAMPEP_0206481894 /NCGR_PEP_ID=MMETSP0324_2-20121206/38478_1 /ASSEMBLY_ACC=CAM_ASM_000836 /TAXON_ID=2866 /ORGANISM="Crypthecodinium cohnii, Strain Seligo" /LENGTH=68 /DNA_ID=CAMNT_0053959593 /DNA_START=316 /DNA_END=518 /DNA_ORIENTATION=-